jgi:hypothetical protein
MQLERRIVVPDRNWCVEVVGRYADNAPPVVDVRLLDLSNQHYPACIRGGEGVWEDLRACFSMAAAASDAMLAEMRAVAAARGGL